VNVSLPEERLIRGRLSALAFLVRTIGADDPTLLLIGEAVSCADAPAVTAVEAQPTSSARR
jgi:uroporphyrin-III C-methyltransferase